MPGVRLLLLKAHVEQHQRHMSNGKVVTVAAHDDARQAATVIPPAWIEGKHSPGLREYLRPIPPDNPFAGGKRKHVRIHHFRPDGGAQVTHPSGYISKHASLDEALEHAERTIYARP